ncbi:MAG: FAD-dependent oxidoreductase, partial [Caulobacteraceae bacterium]|nr:FAD-dependent oxidoreductase [Caulobacteraceae bacterium]
IAGASVAARLAAHRSVVLVEREEHPGWHATSRSVAIFTHALPGVQIAPLTRASQAFFTAPPDGFADAPLTRARPVLQFAQAGEADQLLRLHDTLRDGGGAARWIDGEAARAMVPILRPEFAAAAVLDEDAFEMNVDGLLQGWLRRLRGAGGTVLTASPLRAAARVGDAWRLRVGETEIAARVLVNAAGAWGDEVAHLAGVPGLGLSPRRRTVAVIAADGCDVDGWPMCVAADHRLYFKPEAGRLLVSAMEETPSPACDAYVDDMEVAEALDRFETVTTLPVRRPLRSWAGLRTFAADGEPVAGYDPDAPQFFWLAGQGGAGVQTAPALSEAAAALVLDEPLPSRLTDHGVSEALLSPGRLRRPPTIDKRD